MQELSLEQNQLRCIAAAVSGLLMHEIFPPPYDWLAHLLCAIFMILAFVAYITKVVDHIEEETRVYRVSACIHIHMCCHACKLQDITCCRRQPVF